MLDAFSAFSDIRDYLHELHFEAGDVLVHNNVSERDQLLLVTEGLVEVRYADSDSGQQDGDAMHLINIIEPGQVVGEMGVLNRDARHGVCVAATRGRGLALDKADFSSLVQERPELACAFLLRILPAIVQHLRDSNRRLTSNAQLCRAMEDEINSVNFDNSVMATLIQDWQRPAS